MTAQVKHGLCLEKWKGEQKKILLTMWRKGWTIFCNVTELGEQGAMEMASKLLVYG